MAVVGVDVGDHSTYISVARLGGVETISNDYSLRSTPTIVAFGERQRFMGVSAENQRNLNPKSTVSYFKNTVGRSFNDVESISARYGASVKTDGKGRLLFEIQNREFIPEQAFGMMFTKVKELVAAVEGEIETLVVSVPIYFTQAQKLAVRDAALIAGLHVNQIIADTSALALSYGKTKDLDSEPRNVVFVDIGCEGTQAVLAEICAQHAKILASSYNRVGGKVFDDILVDFAVKLIEEKHKIKLLGNVRALTKIRNAMEKAKKTMSTNTNQVPVQIDSITEDVDVNFTINRVQFEDLIKPCVSEIKETLENLLASTTVKPEQLYGVEIVGGSTRIPILKQTIQDVFGVVPRTELNTDEAVSRGCALQAASLSSKFLTKKFEVEDSVHQGIEAVFVYGGEHEKVLICDEGDSINEEKKIEITADLPLNIALQYAESASVDDKFISLYKVDEVETASGVFSLKFCFNEFEVLELKEILLVSQEKPKARRISESGDDGIPERDMVPCRTVLSYTKSMPEPLSVTELRDQESNLVSLDQEEIHRQEEKNRLEEHLYKFRNKILEDSNPVEKEEVFINLKTYLDEIETWLYEEGEDAPRLSYTELISTLENKLKVYSTWFNKFMLMRKREDEKAKFLEKQGQRQIPIVYEGQDEYVPKQGSPARRGREPFPRDPFGGFGRSSFFDDSPFGW